MAKTKSLNITIASDLTERDRRIATLQSIAIKLFKPKRDRGNVSKLISAIADLDMPKQDAIVALLKSWEISD